MKRVKRQRRGFWIDGCRFASWLIFTSLPLAAGNRELKSHSKENFTCYNMPSGGQLSPP